MYVFSVVEKSRFLLKACHEFDCTIVVGSEEAAQTFKTYKQILMKSSAVFHTMLSGEFKEGLENHITLEHITPTVFKHFLNYLYSDIKAFEPLEFQIVKDIYDFGKLYLVDELCEDIESELLSDACTYDFLELFGFAYLINNEQLMLKCATVNHF